MSSTLLKRFICLCLLLWSFTSLSQTLTEIAPSWQVGDEWNVQVTAQNFLAAQEEQLAPVNWRFRVGDELLLDGHQVWLVTIEADNGANPMQIYVRQSDGQLMRHQTVRPDGDWLVDYVPEVDFSPNLAEFTGAPIVFPAMFQDDATRTYQYTPVLQEQWGFPIEITQTAAPFQGGQQVTLQTHSETVLLEWYEGESFWRTCQTDNYLAVTTFIDPEGKRFPNDMQRDEREESLQRIERNLERPDGAWIPLDSASERDLWQPASAKSGYVIDYSDDQVVWSGHWWPSAGGTDPNNNTYAPGGALYKYDEFYKQTRGSYPSPKARDWESANYAYSSPGWIGHCNGWAAAAILHPEPVQDRIHGSLTFDVGDMKALLSEAYYEIPAWGSGRRYGWCYKYGWKSDGTWGCVDRESDLSDIHPYDFHRVVIGQLGQRKSAVVMDLDPNNAVWNYPAYRYTLSSTPDSQIANRVHVTTRVYFAGTSGADSVGRILKGGAAREFRYYLTVDSAGNPIPNGASAWSSTTTNPDFIWVPYGNPISGSARRHNPSLDWSVVQDIIKDDVVALKLTPTSSPFSSHAADLTAGDEDWYVFTISEQPFIIGPQPHYVVEATAGSLADTYMDLYRHDNGTMVHVDSDDDSGPGYSARLLGQYAPGLYYVKVRAYAGYMSGTYTISHWLSYAITYP